MDIAITFNLSGNDEHNQIFLYAQAGSTTPVGNLNVRFSLVGPDGLAYKPFPSSPDFSFVALGFGQVNIPVPVDSDGNYISGTYTARCVIEDDGSPDPVETFDETFSFDFLPNTTPDSFISPSLYIDYFLSCDTGIEAEGQIKENINPDFWGGASIFDTMMEVIPEAATGEESYDTSGDDILFVFGHTNADYLLRYTLTVELQDPEINPETGNTFVWYHIEKMSAEVTLTPQCVPVDLCKVASCLEKEFKKLYPAICSKGWRGLTKKEKAKFMKAAYIVNIMQMYRDCGNSDKVREYVNIFEQHLDCSCECGGDSSGPQPYVVPNPID